MKSLLVVLAVLVLLSCVPPESLESKLHSAPKWEKTAPHPDPPPPPLHPHLEQHTQTRSCLCTWVDGDGRLKEKVNGELKGRQGKAWV
ncbi:hypothetical protein CB1_001250006 [Camelus ferus]|nr:hypothetical protein CB1_001250006 [Camelus ferus]